MNYSIKKREKQIKIENFIWYIYILLIGASLYSNKLEINYFSTNNSKYKDKYRNINIIIFTILILVYSYFEKDSINSFLEKDKSDFRKKYDPLILLASTSVLLSGIIFLYIILIDESLEEEIAFN